MAEYYYRRLPLAGGIRSLQRLHPALGRRYPFLLMASGPFSLPQDENLAADRDRRDHRIGLGLFQNQNFYSSQRQLRLDYVAATNAKKEADRQTTGSDHGLAGWKTGKCTPTLPWSAAKCTGMRGDYVTVFTHMILQFRGQVSYIYHQPWDLFCMMFIGMGLFPDGIFSNRASTPTYVLLLVVGYGIRIPPWLAVFSRALWIQHPTWAASTTTGGYHPGSGMISAGCFMPRACPAY